MEIFSCLAPTEPVMLPEQLMKEGGSSVMLTTAATEENQIDA